PNPSPPRGEGSIAHGRFTPGVLVSVYEVRVTSTFGERRLCPAAVASPRPGVSGSIFRSSTYTSPIPVRATVRLMAPDEGTRRYQVNCFHFFAGPSSRIASGSPPALS